VRQPSVLVGNSLGGAMVARSVSRRPERVVGAVLVAPAGARVASRRMDDLVKSYTAETVEEARDLFERIYHRPPKLVARLVAPWFHDLLRRPHVLQLLREAAELGGLTPEEVEHITPPLLVLWGRSERVLPYEGVEFFRRHLPASAQLEEMEGFGHCPHLERPAQLCDRIDRFIPDAVMPRLKARVA
jgi:pimeloyl-ACP methyl ester carboxylesterase